MTDETSGSAEPVTEATAAPETSTTEVDTTASVRLSQQGEGFVIDRIALTMQASVPGIDDAAFQGIAAAAKRDCPLSKALAGVAEITLTATLK